MNLRSSHEMDLSLLLVILFFLLLGPSHSHVPCETLKVTNKLETNCELRGLKSVPLKLSIDTAILHLSNNNLKSFSTSSLSLLTQLTELYLAKNNMSVLVTDGKLPLLSILDLSDNELKTVLPLGHSLPSLTFLDLSRNALESLSPETLAGLSSLENLYLRGNKLRSLPPNFLKAAAKLQKLDLANNYLEHLSADLLAGLTDLNTLFLQNNLLSVLPPRFFGDHFLPYVFLHSNPWNCNCELLYLHYWLKENKGNVYLWKEGVDVKVMTPDVSSVQCEVPTRTPVYTFSMNCPGTGDKDYDSYDEYDELTVKGILGSETTTIPTTISLKYSTVFRSSEPTTFLITSGKRTFPTTGRSTKVLNSPETTVLSTTLELIRFLISSEATPRQITSEPNALSENLETIRFPTSLEATTFPVTSETTMLQNTPEVTTFPVTSETTMLQNTPEATTFPVTSETTMLQNTPEATTFPVTSETTMLQNTPEATTFPVTSETTMFQSTPELVTFPTTDSTSSIPVTSSSLPSTLTLLKSNILPPHEAVTLGSLGDPSDSSSPTSISCCLLSLRLYIFGIAWVLLSSIVLILLLVLVQPPPHLLRTHTFMEDIPNPRATVYLELHRGKEVIVHRAWLLFLEGSIPSFCTRLFLWVRSNGQVGPLTLKRKPSAVSLGRGEDLLGSVSIRYSGHSL